MNTLVARMIRAAKLEPALYEEVEQDTTALGQAMTVVLLSSLAAAIASFRGGFGVLALSFVAALVGWFLWAVVVFLIGTKVLPEPQTKSDLGELLRTIGFSSSPGVIRVLGVIPGLGLITSFIAAVWSLVAMIIAIRQALDYTSTGRAVAVAVIGWLVFLVVSMLVGGIGAFGAAMMS